MKKHTVGVLPVLPLAGVPFLPDLVSPLVVAVEPFLPKKYYEDC